MAAEKRHPLADRIRELPEWTKWMLHGIVFGQPLDDDEVLQHVLDADPAAELPDVPELETLAPVQLDELRLGVGCYGLAENTLIPFGRRLTLIYGENGTGKSSLARILRAIAGRPSGRRPPQNSFTREAAEATINFTRAGSAEQHLWRSNDEQSPFHVEVFDSADTRIDGTEYQVRPRSVLALEELRHAVDDLVFDVPDLVIPASLREVLTDEDLGLLADPSSAAAILDQWRALRPPRSVSELERELASLGDDTLATGQTAMMRRGNVAKADDSLMEFIERLDLPDLAQRLAAAESAEPDLAGVQAPRGVDAGTWRSFIETALPLFEGSPDRCVLCDSPIAPRHAHLVGAYRALLDEQRAETMRAIDQAKRAIQDEILTHGGASENATTAARSHATVLSEALNDYDHERLAGEVQRTTELAAAARRELADARAEWRAGQERLGAAEERRTALRQEIAMARRSQLLRENLATTAELSRHLRDRERLDAASRTQGTKQRINTALRRQTMVELEKPYGQTLQDRIKQFKVPHVEKLTSRHIASAGQAVRSHRVGKEAVDELFSEGEQRALALADFAAELDTRRDTRHPIVIDDPVSSLDYRRLENVVDYVRELVESGRQVIVLTHSVWLATALLKQVNHRYDGPTREHSGSDRAWRLIRAGTKLGETVRLSNSALGDVDRLAERVDALIGKAEQEHDVEEQSQIITQAFDVFRAWCESHVEQRVLCGVVTRLHWQVEPGALKNIDARKIEQGKLIARLYSRLHQRVGAHCQPGELMHRSDSLDDLKDLWAQANGARRARPPIAEPSTKSEI